MNRAAVCALLSCITAACGRADSPTTGKAEAARPAPTTNRIDPLAKGREIYNFRCYFCHGYSGDAKTLAATYLSPSPRDFTASTPEQLPAAAIASAVRKGRPGTGMKSFAATLDERDIEAVAGFVFDEFVVRKARNTRYHTAENGWPEHQRYQVAYPFALGQIALTRDGASLSPEEQSGRRLYLESCVSCHDRGKPTSDDAVIWDSRPLSYPRNNYDHRRPEVDATTSATPYRLHDVAPQLVAASPRERQGEKIYQDNCAFCHAADGTGKNWIGSFLEPHPRNLANPEFLASVSRDHLRQVIRNGLPGTSMPAWKAVLSEQDIDSLIAYILVAFRAEKQGQS